jgi:uncharacterized membrane protein
VGARLSATSNDSLIRPALVIVLFASGLKLINVPTEIVGILVVAILLGIGLRLVLVARSDKTVSNHESVDTR